MIAASETLAYLLFLIVSASVYWYNRKSNGFFSNRRTLYATIGLSFFLLIWSLAALYRMDGITRIPSPTNTVVASGKLLLDSTFHSHVIISFKRIIIGFGLASILGIAVGFFAGLSNFFRHLLLPSNSFLRYIPPTAFVSLMIVYFGIGEEFKYAIIFLGVYFFIVQMTVDIVEDIDVNYLNMAKSSGFSHIKIFTTVVLPSSSPRILDMLRVNLSGAWTFLIAAEIIGGGSGLGFFVSLNQRLYRIEELYSTLLIFGVIGILTDGALQWISKLAFRWNSDD